MDAQEGAVRRIIGGVDTHKDLHVAAVVDEQGRVLATQSFASTRQGYRQMLAWMRSFGEVQRVGVESTGSYGAGLLRFLQQAGVTVLEVTTPDRQDRRRRGKNDDFDAQNAAHAAFAGIRTVTPKSRDGMIEALRVLSACRKTAVTARRIALQMIQNTIVCAPESLREMLRRMTRMQLVRTLAAWRPDLTAYRDVEAAYRIPDQPEVPGPPLSRAARRNRRPGCHDRRHRQRVGAQPGGAELHWTQGRRTAAPHGRRQSAAAALGGRLCGAVRGQPRARLVGENGAPSAEPGRRSSRQ